jgi:AraC family transcriptional regulator of adaptative response/methylated-DNA-[protein]-cysteine methyltransferase
MIKTTVIETPLGNMTAAATREGLCLLEFIGRKELQSEIEEIGRILNMNVEPGSCKHLRALKKQLKEYFKGKRKEFSIPLVKIGTDFQKEVWMNLLRIPYGKTISYMEQAELMNNPKAVRAVANANGSNRIAILIPCHRVIGSDGDLTGYGGGLERKRWLIDHEKLYSGQPVDGILF